MMTAFPMTTLIDALTGFDGREIIGFVDTCEWIEKLSYELIEFLYNYLDYVQSMYPFLF